MLVGMRDNVQAGALFIFGGVSFAALFNYAFHGAAARDLGAESFGTVAAAFATLAILGTFAGEAIAAPTSKYISESTALGRSWAPVVRSGGIVAGVAILAILIIALAVKDWVTPSLFGGDQFIFWLVVLGGVAFVVASFVVGVLSGHRRLLAVGLFQFVLGFGRISSLVLLTIFLGLGTRGAIASLAAAPLLASFVAVSLWHRRPSHPSTARTNLGLATFARFSSLSLFLGVSTAALHHSGTIVARLSSANGEALAGSFFAATIISMIPLRMVFALVNALYPNIAALSFDRARFRSLYLRSMVVISVTSLGFLLFTAATDQLPIKLLFGEGFEVPTLSLVALMLAFMFDALAWISRSILLVLEEFRVVFGAKALAILVFITVAVLLSFPFGVFTFYPLAILAAFFLEFVITGFRMTWVLSKESPTLTGRFARANEVPGARIPNP